MRPQSRLRSLPIAAALAAILGLSLSAAPAVAGESDREGRWQFSLPVTFTSGTTVDGENGTHFNMSDDVGFGLGFGYNLNPHFMFGVDFTWISANYTANISRDANGDGRPDGTTEVSGTFDATNLQFSAQYNILKGRVTPFLRAGFGWSWIDSNIPSGLPQTGCWWDPWYGYICNTFQPTYSDTVFAYTAAAGVRGELTQRFFVEASYQVLWIDTKNSGTPSIDGARISAGWTF